MRKRGCGQPLADSGCHPVRRRRGDCPPGVLGKIAQTYEDVVAAFIRDRRPLKRRHLEFYRGQPTFEDAVRVAALSIRGPDQKRHSHQCRIPGAALNEAWRALRTAPLREAKDFDALHDLVVSTTRGIPKIGALACYDIAERIGVQLGLQPDKLVYLHAGARDGARALGIHGDIVDKRGFPATFRRLSAAELEDCLCVYKDDLARIAQRQAFQVA